MSYSKYLLILVLPFFVYQSFAQKFTLNGYVSEQGSGEKLIGANIFNNITLQGTITNNFGFYSFTQKTGKVKIRFSYVGYETKVLEFNLKQDTTLNIQLNKSITLSEVVIKDSKIKEKIESTQMSISEIPMKTIKALPVLLGEIDVIKAVQLLPGVQSGSEGSSGVYVRGGGPDETLILLDGVPVYNTNHLFGFFSVFHGDAIQKVTLIKGGFPARYGGRLSSIMDIRMKEGNMKEFHAEGSVGIVASKITIEGPIKKDTSSFIFSARRTYIDILAMPLIVVFMKANGVNGRAGYYFYDLNAKVNYIFSNKSRLYVSGYFGRDKMYMNAKEKYNNTKFNFNWGNATFVARHNYIINKKLFVNSRLSYTQYKNSILLLDESTYENHTYSYQIEPQSQIFDYAATVDFDYMPSPNHYVRFGFSDTYHQFTPGVTTFQIKEGNTAIDSTMGFKTILAHELDAYIEDDISLSKRLKMNLGAHLSGFAVEGVFYKSLQPRASVRYLASSNVSVKASYVQMTQYLHLLTNSNMSFPTDIWVPVTEKTAPMHSTQYALGVFYNYKDEWEFSIEGYYKEMKNVIDYKEGSSYFSMLSYESWEDLTTTGKGWAYGIELLAKRNIGKLSGWIGYTLAWANRQFNGVDYINFGKVFPYKYDRRHDIGAAIHYQMFENIDAGLVWVFGSGYPATLPTQQYLNPLNTQQEYWGSTFINYFDTRNNFRMPAYHRLDIGINFHKKTKWGERKWSVGAYNTYNRRNPFLLYVKTDWETGENAVNQLSILPIIPYLSYAFKF